MEAILEHVRIPDIAYTIIDLLSVEEIILLNITIACLHRRVRGYDYSPTDLLSYASLSPSCQNKVEACVYLSPLVILPPDFSLLPPYLRLILIMRLPKDQVASALFRECELAGGDTVILQALNMDLTVTVDIRVLFYRIMSLKNTELNSRLAEMLKCHGSLSSYHLLKAIETDQEDLARNILSHVDPTTLYFDMICQANQHGMYTLATTLSRRLGN